MSQYGYRWQKRRQKYSCGQRVKNMPKTLPHAIAPEDVKQLVRAITDTRDRAIILILLRTGMRIGELLNVKLEDIVFKEQKVIIPRSAKESPGRVVYFSNDAKVALKAWLKKRGAQKESLFYSQGRKQLTYGGARGIFNKWVKKAGLFNKGYTLHCLRHTYASELLSAGMRLESLQKLMGHSNMEITRRYARLTDKALEQEYFRTISIVERGEIHGKYQLRF
ncbi:MAG: phage integrase family protein [Deltaproteobacteria bacterium]|nr:phage integrase family protein [Deltaproteobacteria bacterium]MBW2317989.1 phage integrase family protein [Deltaproteobacteria bacterium]